MADVSLPTLDFSRPEPTPSPTRAPVSFDELVKAIRSGVPTQGLRPVAIDQYKRDPNAKCIRRTPKLRNLDAIHFLHIPKTGGWFVEDSGMWHLTVNNTRWKAIWGRFLPEYPKFPGGHAYGDCLNMHTPPSYFWDSGHPEWLRNNRTFCVVREPLARAISMTRFRASTEMDYHVCKDEGWLNAYLLDNVMEAMHVNGFKLPRYKSPDVALIGPNKVPRHTCSWIPQSQFVFDDEGCRICDDVLEFSKLNEQFPVLMRAYGFEFNNSTDAPLKKNNAKRCVHLTVDSLLPFVQDMARVLYKTDYDRLTF